MTDQMVNTGVVAALIGGMVGGALMSDAPAAEGSFLNQGFIVLNIASLYYSINAVGISVMCLIYLQVLVSDR